MDLNTLKHNSEYDDPYNSEVFELWSHNDCTCKACNIFFGGK